MPPFINNYLNEWYRFYEHFYQIKLRDPKMYKATITLTSEVRRFAMMVLHMA
jgi:hypothetical protein